MKPSPAPRVNPRGTPPPFAAAPAPQAVAPSGGQLLALVLSWVGVSLPLAWGVLETLRKTMALFQ
ncbi:MAG: hypothetical protein ABI895_30025 [Deltaproteobacteria bacterium]